MTLDKFSHRSIGNLFLYKQSYTHTFSTTYFTQYVNVPIVGVYSFRNRKQAIGVPKTNKSVRQLYFLHVIVGIDNPSEPYNNILRCVYDRIYTDNGYHYITLPIYSHIIFKYFNVRPYVIFFGCIDFTGYLFIENRSCSCMH